MESFNQILEEELENSFEVKDKKALHRSVLLLSEHIVSREKHENAFAQVGSRLGELKSDIALIAESMKQGFAAMEKRFEAVDKRFEDVNKRFDDVNKRFDDVNKRFDDVNKRFDDVNKRFGESSQSFRRMIAFMTTIFVVLGVLMSVYEFIR